MSRIFRVYFWSAVGILATLLVVPLYTQPLAEAYVVVAYILVIQSLSTTLDFGFNALILRDACTRKDPYTIMGALSQIEIIFICLWCCGFLIMYFYVVLSGTNFYLNSTLMMFCLMVAGVFRLLMQFQRSILYSVGRQVLTTKVLAICSLVKVLTPYPFLNFDAETNAMIYLAVYAVMNFVEYCVLRQINGGLFARAPNMGHFVEFIKKYKVSILSLSFASVVLTISTQIEKTATWTRFEEVNTVHAAYSLQISGLMLVAFGPISQILQPEILKTNLEFNTIGLTRVIRSSSACQFFFTLGAVLVLWSLPNVYHFLTQDIWDKNSSLVLAFFMFLALSHIQNSFMYYYNVARNKLAHQPFLLSAILIFDLIIFFYSFHSLALFAVAFCCVRFYVSNFIFLAIHRENLRLEFILNFILNHMSFVVLALVFLMDQ